MKSIENKKLSYLANTNFLLGLFVPGPVGLHLIVYTSYEKKTLFSFPNKLHSLKAGTNAKFVTEKYSLIGTLECSLKS